MASLVLNVPYGGVFMPPAVIKHLGFATEELGWENFRLADPLLLQVLTQASQGTTLNGSLGEKVIPKRTLISYRFSPLVADPLGTLAQELGDKEATGPSFISLSTMGKPISPWKDQEGEFIIKKSVEPYLAELENSCRKGLEEDTLVLLISFRSYASKPWNYENERRYPRPQIAIGTHSEKKSPKGLAEFLGKTFKVFNFWPELNWPHKGAFLPQDLLALPRLFAVNISFRKDLYMNEQTGKLAPSAESFTRVLMTIFSLLDQELDTVIKIRKRRKYPPKPPKAPSNVIKLKNED